MREPVQLMRPAAEFLAELLHFVKGKLYDGRPWAARYYKEQDMLMKALTEPARWFFKNDLPLSEERFREVVQTVVIAILTKRVIQQPKCMALYFHACLQSHMAHNRQAYNDESKGLRDEIESWVLGAKRNQGKPMPVLAPVADMSEIYRQLRAKPRRGKTRAEAVHGNGSTLAKPGKKVSTHCNSGVPGPEDSQLTLFGDSGRDSG